MSFRRTTTSATVSAIEKTMLAMDPAEAVAFARIIAAEGMRYTREHEGALIEKFFDARLDGLERDVVRAAVSKSLRGEPIDTEEHAWTALQAIRKARSADDWRKYDRDMGGRFSVREEDVEYAGGKNPNRFTPESFESKVVIPARTGFVNARGMDANAQPGAAAFLRMKTGANLLEQTFGNSLPPQALLAARTADYVGTIGPHAAQVVVPAADKTAARYRGIERHEIDPVLAEQLSHNTASVREEEAAANGEVDANEAYQAQVGANKSRYERTVEQTRVLAAMGPAADLEPEEPFLDVTGELLPQPERERRNDHNQRQENIRRSNRAKREGAGISKPEARKALREARRRLDAENLAARKKLLVDVKDARVARGAETLKAISVRRKRLVHGFVDEETKDWNPGPVLRYWQAQLPDADMNDLQVKSGTVPPSQGMIMDARGKITSQAAGYGDDWYTPFPLKKLSSLKGGEYVRTRTFGGPTTEDIYTGLLHGARAVTVVSHSGTFTIEFDDALTGGRRFNDKALRMTDRYAALLDAVRSGQIRIAKLDPYIDDEIQAEANAIHPPLTSPKENKDEVRRLQSELRSNPRLSRERQGELAEAWLNERIADQYGRHVEAERFRGPGKDMSVDRALQQKIAERVIGDVNAHKAKAALDGYELADDDVQAFAGRDRSAIEASLQGTDAADTAQRAADFLGLGPQLESYVHGQAIDAVNGSSPLVLNGRGYKAAMDGLKEQFPYYIRDVQWHQWKKNAVGPRDTGYVKPGRNRPAMANVGFYGHDMGDRGPNQGLGGKLAAESVRWQESEPRAPGRAPTGTAPEQPAASGVAAPSPAAAPERVQRVRRDANAAMFDWLRGRTVFGPQAKDPAGVDIANKGVPTSPSDVSQMPAPIATVFAADPEQFKTRLRAGDVEAEGQLRRAADFAKTNTLFDGMDGDVPGLYWRGGMTAQAGGPVKEWHEYLDDTPGSPWAGDAFTGKADPQIIARTYARAGEIKALVSTGHDRLPAGPDWSEADFKTARRIERDLRRQDEELNQLVMQNNPANNAVIARTDADLQTRAKGLKMARTLARSYADSKARISDAADAAETARQQGVPLGLIIDEQTGEERMMTDQEFLARTGKLPNHGRTVITP